MTALPNLLTNLSLLLTSDKLSKDEMERMHKIKLRLEKMHHIPNVEQTLPFQEGFRLFKIYVDKYFRRADGSNPGNNQDPQRA